MQAVAEHPKRIPFFNSENAREMQRKGNEAKKALYAKRKALADSVSAPQSESIDPLAADLARVQQQIVNKMLKANGDSESIPKLARSFRDVREAFHLVTGQAKPGVIRETGRTSKRSAKPTPLPSAPQDQGGNAG